MCNTPKLDKGGISMVDNAVKIMKEMMAALNSQNFEKASSFFTDDLVYEDVPSGMVFHGVKEFIDFARLVRIDFPDRKWEMKSSFSDGDKIATESVWSGTFTHSSNPERPATGKSVSLQCVSITELRNGKICRNRDYYDGLSFQQQLGT
jgi:steroid delta-isomerase-like uncharacterized protein